jgi:hypothetical protein
MEYGPMLLAGLTTSHMIGMLIIAGIFIAFALVCSFVIPRRNPDFPGEKGIGVFAIVCVVLFVAQLASVILLGVEKEESPQPATGAAHVQQHAAHSRALASQHLSK